MEELLAGLSTIVEIAIEAFSAVVDLVMAVL